MSSLKSSVNRKPFRLVVGDEDAFLESGSPFQIAVRKLVQASEILVGP
jgi:hypothetical protein